MPPASPCVSQVETAALLLPLASITVFTVNTTLTTEKHPQTRQVLEASDQRFQEGCDSSPEPASGAREPSSSPQPPAPTLPPAPAPSQEHQCQGTPCRHCGSQGPSRRGSCLTPRTTRDQNSQMPSLMQADTEVLGTEKPPAWEENVPGPGAAATAGTQAPHILVLALLSRPGPLIPGQQALGLAMLHPRSRPPTQVGNAVAA